MAFVLCQTLLPAAVLAWLIPRETEQNLGPHHWPAGFALGLISPTGLRGCKFAEQSFIRPKVNGLEAGMLGSCLYIFSYIKVLGWRKEVSAWGQVL